MPVDEKPPTSPARRAGLRSVKRLLLQPTVVVVLGTMYLYFLGWVVLYAKMAGMGLLHELRNLPPQEYISCLALIISSWTATAGIAVIARAFSKRWWMVALAGALYFQFNAANGLRDTIGDGGVDARFVYPGLNVAALSIVAALLITFSIWPTGLRLVKKNMKWRWGGRSVVVAMAMFMLFHDAFARGIEQGNQILRAQRSVWVRSKDQLADEWLGRLNLGVLMQVGDRWYFHDRDLTDRLRGRVMPIGIAQDQILEIRSFADPIGEPKMYSDMLKYMEEVKKRPARTPELPPPGVGGPDAAMK